MKFIKSYLSSVKAQVTLILLIFTLIPSVLIGTLSIYSTYKNGIKSAITNTQIISKMVTNDIGQIMNDCFSVSNMVVSDPVVQRFLRNHPPQDLADKYKNELLVNEKLHFFNNYAMETKKIFGIYVMGLNGGIYKSNSHALIATEFDVPTQIQQLLTTNAVNWTYSKNSSLIVKVLDGDFIQLHRIIFDLLTGNPLGVIIIELNLDDTLEPIRAFNETSDHQIAIFANNQCIYPSRQLSNDEYQMHNFTSNYKINNSQLKYSQKLPSGWDIVSLIQVHPIKADSFSLIKPILLIDFCIILLVIFLAISIAKKITAPIEVLSASMKLVEQGNLDQQIPININSKNEISQLMFTYNNMIMALKNYIIRIRSKEKQLQDIQFSMLQAQIQPHFLYNTLDSIIWLAKAKDYPSIEKITTSLIKLLKYSLNSESELISAEDEIDHVKQYLTILKIRYGSKLSYTINVPPTLSNYKLPRFTLQPFVENAVLHGINQKITKGVIKIECFDKSNEILFKISDNGIGLSETELNLLNTKNSRILKNQIGIANVKKRLALLFDNKAHVWFTGKLDIGTTVHISIPKTINGICS